ncbi:MAG: hypothetical protein KJO02_04875 [Erythrobacter sp.]|nr:hypothetical protein [Erythrobacter sp.]
MPLKGGEEKFECECGTLENGLPGFRASRPFDYRDQYGKIGGHLLVGEKGVSLRQPCLAALREHRAIAHRRAGDNPGGAKGMVLRVQEYRLAWRNSAARQFRKIARDQIGLLRR